MLPFYAGNMDGFTNDIRVAVGKPSASELCSERKVGRSQEGARRPLPPSQVWADTGLRVCRGASRGGLGGKGPECVLPNAACLRPGREGGLPGRQGLRPSSKPRSTSSLLTPARSPGLGCRPHREPSSASSLPLHLLLPRRPEAAHASPRVAYVASLRCKSPSSAS